MGRISMKRSNLGLDVISDVGNLYAAFHSASRGKADHPAVRSYADDLDRRTASLRQRIMAARVQAGPMTSFWINDPKRRLIHAPCFEDRVLHHAVMAQVGPVLERALVFDTYACRVGKGALAAVKRCQDHARRYPIFVKIDISGYFPAIDHQCLNAMLARKFKDEGVRRLLEDLISGYAVNPGKGLPIGALTSQHFANFYLSRLDRFLLETLRVRGMVRYMDDIVWWLDDRETARETLDAVRAFVGGHLHLAVKQSVQVGRSAAGLLFCGFRVSPARLGLSRRRRERYSALRRTWERAYARGGISASELQTGYASALAITIHADAVAWRREQLSRRPLAAAVQAL